MAFIGFRANMQKHRKIVRWLIKFENQSEEIRRLLELGIDVSEGKYQAVTISNIPEPQPPKTIDWSHFPKEPSVESK